MNITEKSAYIKGLAEGLGLDTAKPEGKIISALLDLVSELSAKVADLEKECETLNDYIEEIDEDLGFVEDIVYDDEDEDDEDDEDEFDCDLNCEGCPSAAMCGMEDFEEFEDEDEDDEDDDEDGFRCLMCPSCNEKIYFDESIDPADLICPACGKAVCEDDEEGADEV